MGELLESSSGAALYSVNHLRRSALVPASSRWTLRRDGELEVDLKALLLRRAAFSSRAGPAAPSPFPSLAGGGSSSHLLFIPFLLLAQSSNGLPWVPRVVLPVRPLLLGI